MPSNLTPTSPVDVLRSLGVDFLIHAHPPIRTESDIQRETEFSIEHSVKTLVFSVTDGHLVLAAIPGRDRISYGRLAQAIGVPRNHLKQAATSQLGVLGMEPGGISPICRVDNVTVVFDTLIATMDKVYCGSGVPDQTIEINAYDLMRIAPRSLVATIIADG